MSRLFVSAALMVFAGTFCGLFYALFGHGIFNPFRVGLLAALVMGVCAPFLAWEDR